MGVYVGAFVFFSHLIAGLWRRFFRFYSLYFQRFNGTL